MSARQQNRRNTGKRPIKPPKDRRQQEVLEVEPVQVAAAGAPNPSPAAPQAVPAKKRKLVEIRADGAPEIDERNYASEAERLISNFKDSGSLARLTTTKLRGIYGLITNVYTRVGTQAEFEEHIADVQYLRVRMAYEAGRDNAVRMFLAGTGLMALAASVGDLDQFRLYCRYAEALVAYFKFFGGKD